MAHTLRTITPVDGSVYVERPLATPQDIDAALDAAVEAQKAWRRVPVTERQAILSRAVDAFVARREEIAAELSWQMGRPVSQSPGEVGGFEERARHMIAIAPEALADVVPQAKSGFNRFIRRQALGVVAIIAGP